MNQDRARILAEIRRRQSGRVATALPALRPRPNPMAAELWPLFCQRAEAVQARCQRLACIAELPTWLAPLTATYPPPLLIGPSTDWKDLIWPGPTSAAPAQGLAQLSLSRGLAAVAESGSVLLSSGVGQPYSHYLAVDHHVVVITPDQLVPDLEAALALIADLHRPPARAWCLVTGPSRTADIELTLALGAHGPKRLDILLVGA